MNKDQYDRITAMSSMAIAIMALFITVYDGCQERRHQRLSLRPLLSAVYSTTYGYGNMSLKVSNQGLGPAIVTAAKFCMDGNPIEGGIYTQLLSQLLIVHTNVADILAIHASECRPGAFIQPQAEIEFLSLSTTNRDRNLQEALQNCFSRYTVVIEYKSLYDEQFFLGAKQ